MSHKCNVLVITCIDYRFRSAIRDFLLSNGLKGDYDMVSLAGATKDLVENDQHGRALIIKQIDIANRLHGINEVYIIHHMDCGAYGGSSVFASSNEEKKRHTDDMEVAKKIIGEGFSDIKVKKVLARLELKGGEDQIDFELMS